MDHPTYFKRIGHPTKGTVSRLHLGDMVIEFWDRGFTRRQAKRIAQRNRHTNNITVTDDMGRVQVRARHSRATR